MEVVLSSDKNVSTLLTVTGEAKKEPVPTFMRKIKLISTLRKI